MLLVHEVLYFFHSLNDYGFEYEELEELTVEQLQGKWVEESSKREVNIQIPMEIKDDEKWEALNKVFLDVSKLLSRAGIAMDDEGSGFGMGVREYHFQFQRIKDKEKYEPIINEMFEAVK